MTPVNFSSYLQQISHSIHNMRYYGYQRLQGVKCYVIKRATFSENSAHVQDQREPSFLFAFAISRIAYSLDRIHTCVYTCVSTYTCMYAYTRQILLELGQFLLLGSPSPSGQLSGLCYVCKIQHIEREAGHTNEELAHILPSLIHPLL